MRRNTLARFGLLATLPISSLLFACGGSSDKKVDMEDWVADLCDAAADFDKASDKAGDAFGEADFDDTKEAKAAFKESVADQKDAQKDFRSAFNKLGQPDIEDGDKVVDAFKERFDENDDQVNDVAKAIADIDDDDDFLEEFLKVADDFDTPDFREKLDDLADDSDDVQDLIDEIDADEDCSSVIFDSAGADDTTSVEPTPKASGTAVASKTVAAPTAAAAKTTNEKWVSGICTSFTSWVNDLEKANTKLDGVLTNAKDAPDIKQALVDFLKAGQAETKNLQKEVNGLKAPDVKDGAAIHKVFVDASGQLVTVFDNLVSDAQKVGTSSLSQTTADVERLSQGIGDAFTNVGNTFDKLDSYNSTAIEDLFDTRPECADFK